MAKVVVIGLDGVTWKILKPWVERNELPNLAKMVKEGSAGILETQTPPLTCPAWKYYSTGKNAAKLGVFSRTDIDFESGKITPVDSTNYKSKEIWDYLGAAGKKVGVIDMPTTYPPKKINGFMIGSIEPPNYDNYTYPKKLQKELKEKFNYKPDVEGRLDLPTDELKDEIFSLIETRFDILDANLDKADFLHLTIVFTDYIMHFYWNDDFSKKIFKKIDECIGKTMQKAGRDCTFIIMSDHGFARLKAMFLANIWLQKEGYQKTKEGMTNTLFKLGINKETAVGLLKKLGLEKIVKKLVPAKVTKKIKSSHGLIGGEAKGYLFDWKKSKVISHASNLFYINPNLSEVERKHIAKEIKEKLLEVRLPGTGDTVIEKIFSKEEIYNGPYLDKAPDLITLAKPWCEVCSPLGGKEIFELGSRWIATHHKDGVFIVKGNGIKKGFDAGKASIFDLAPTIMKLMKVKQPKGLDGRILEEIFEKGVVA